ncbi:MAG: KEOPS complex subunit Pcc1 [Natronomonas sp.]|jgi:tRNA threonylcarbamoyladenosine modification (KEOPS) complex  Pcc1 subunit|uniref:KEOPS complex Pcc1-like subunit n=1 Tax=Natronomonas salsuginis TaxID=2217661 RepID=A0A4V5ZP46_9EURY|nr:KEOPS complex subunit Pcc1 [Natronomonas salsuginis]MDR9381761.1 KEOPS complex subunit Pcc1 [Natronomonas sp.]TKR26303.1 KEOPS complex Pcc1-like subunit [Natronomonas salsuginis]
MTDDSRRATIRTVHEHPDVIAAAIAPDNTDEMSTRVESDGSDGGAVVTTIRRETTGGLRTTVDDYVSNLTVAQRITDTTIQS